MDRFYLIHETTYTALQQILASGYLYVSSKTQSMFVTGQGSKNRRLAHDPKISLINPNFYELYDEVDGVYLRLHPRDKTIRSQFSECVMVFSLALLRHFPFVVNTEENFGFFIDREGVVNESQFSGEPGFSISTVENLKLLKDIDPRSSEVLILKDVPISYVKYLFFTKPPPAPLTQAAVQQNVPTFNVS